MEHSMISMIRLGCWNLSIQQVYREHKSVDFKMISYKF